jgi:CTP synthase (UTP-ammonia lyase)
MARPASHRRRWSQAAAAIVHPAAVPLESCHCLAFRVGKVSRITTRIGLVGDYNADVPAHQAIPRALALAERALGTPLEFRWLPTETIKSDAALASFDALWCVPASPYRSMEGALRAIRFARAHARPFLGGPPAR